MAQSPDPRGRRTSGLRLDPEVRKGLKALAAVYGMTMEDYVDQLIRREVAKENVAPRPTLATSAAR